MPVSSEKYRRINIGFKPEGTDPSQDCVFEVLKALDKKGAKAQIITKAILEYVEVHQGVIGSGGMGKVLILSSSKEATSITKKKRSKEATLPQSDLETTPLQSELTYSENILPRTTSNEEPISEKEASRINCLLDFFSGK